MGIAAPLLLLFTVINCDTRTEDIREEPRASVYASRFVAALPFPGRGMKSGMLPCGFCVLLKFVIARNAGFYS